MVAGPVKYKLPLNLNNERVEDLLVVERRDESLGPRWVAQGSASTTTLTRNRGKRQSRMEMKKRASIETDQAMSAANFYIPTLPGLPSDSTLSMYGGHIPSIPSTSTSTAGSTTSTTTTASSSETVAHLYFFMLKARHIADKERTIFWFNGGPGCSSFDGSMMEVGPLRLVPGSKGTLKEVQAAWNEYANIVFIDQPAGTGYSYVATNKYIHELPEAADHVVEFLVRFYSVFPEFSRHDTYLAGESYAGQYIPYIARAILDSARITTPLKGVLIGNGWIDPYSQYPAYLDFAIQSGVIKKGSEAEKKVRTAVTDCLASIEKLGGITKVKIHNGMCENILAEITDSTSTNVNGQDMCVNNYDVRLTDVYPACGMNWPPDLADITPYLQREDVKKAFHASRHEGGWVECNGGVGGNFWAATSEPSVRLLPKLLEEIPILLFAGDQDLICNHLGIERLIEGMTWNGAQGFGNTTPKEWSVNAKPAGEWTTARNLTFVKIAGASHMVPYDQPLAAHDMLLRFLGVDLLDAAGSSARVPSTVGDEVEAVVGETKVDGTAVKTSANGVIVEESGVKVDNSELGSKGDLDKSGLGNGTDSSVMEGLVNVGAALVIIMIMLFGLCIFFVLRRKMRTYSAVLGSASPGLGRRKSLGRGQGIAERTHEMDNLVVPNGQSEDEESGLGGRGRSPSEVFGVGEYDEDEDHHDRK